MPAYLLLGLLAPEPCLGTKKTWFEPRIDSNISVTILWWLHKNGGQGELYGGLPQDDLV